MLRIRNLVVEKSGHTICTVNDLKIDRGERVGIVGDNGCGKTTLLRIVGGLDLELSGELQVDANVRERVFVHQFPFLFRGSVLFNAKFGLRSRFATRQQRTTHARHWLQVFGVGHLEKRLCSKLSGGERRRVALARAFAVEPELLLLDEPLADLDADGIELVGQAIAANTVSTVLVSSPVTLPLAIVDRSFNIGTQNE